MKPNEIKELRESLKMSRKEFASVVGVSHRTVEKWEYGTRNPRGSAIKLMQGLK